MTSVIFDMDGVLYRSTDSLPGAASTVSEFQARGWKTGFLTNNSARTRENYVEKLAGHGIMVDKSQVMTSGEATARYLIEEGHSGKRAYVVGMEGLCNTLSSAGFEVDCDDEGDPCELVVIGWDRGFTFKKIARAQREILFNGAEFFATNADAMFPAKGGGLLPGAGSMVCAVETATGRRATIIGKPKTISLRYLLKELGEDNAPPDDVWVVGDRLDTDIACGNAYGAHTVCVTTGIASREDAENATGDNHPDFIIDTLADLPGLIG
jgi:4-nitrophenyl phosphatase